MSRDVAWRCFECRCVPRRVPSALDQILRRAGAVFADRHGVPVAVSYGSAAGELAACVSRAGIADSSQLTKLELSGPPAAIAELVRRATGGALAPGGIVALRRRLVVRRRRLRLRRCGPGDRALRAVPGRADAQSAERAHRAIARDRAARPQPRVERDHGRRGRDGERAGRARCVRPVRGSRGMCRRSRRAGWPGSTCSGCWRPSTGRSRWCRASRPTSRGTRSSVPDGRRRCAASARTRSPATRCFSSAPETASRSRPRGRPSLISEAGR